MTLLHDSPALTRAIGEIEALLVPLRKRLAEMPASQRRTLPPRQPYDDPREELEAEINAMQHILSRLREVDTGATLQDIYHAALGFTSRIAEYPTTIGENRAGIYLKNMLGGVLEELGLHQLPHPKPKPGHKGG